jgi:hypothetical protein
MFQQSPNRKQKILSNPAAWDALTPDQQTQIIGLLPDESRESHIQRSTEGNGVTRIKAEFLKYDVDFSHAIANVQDDLRNHSYTPKAMRDAINASAERKLFNTKEPCENEAEFLEAWGVLPPDALSFDSLEEDSDHLMGGMVADRGLEGKDQEEILHEQEVPKEEVQETNLKVDEAGMKEVQVGDKFVEETQLGVVRGEGGGGGEEKQEEDEEEVQRVKRMRVDEESGDVSAGVGIAAA